MGQLDRQKNWNLSAAKGLKGKKKTQTAGGVSDIVISDSMWDGQTCFVLTVLCLQCLISLGQTQRFNYLNCFCCMLRINSHLK